MAARRVDWSAAVIELHEKHELAQTPQSADLSKRLRELLEPVHDYEKHILRWGHQTTRHEIDLEQLLPYAFEILEIPDDLAGDKWPPPVADQET